MKYETQRLMFSSLNGSGRTPKDLFDQLDSEFHFNVDVCGDIQHKLRPNLSTWMYNFGLGVTWDYLNCYMNPPYGKEIKKWLSKASIESVMNHATVVALLPARTDTRWFWAYCSHREIRFIKGRLRFEQYNGVAPFPSMIVVFKP